MGMKKAFIVLILPLFLVSILAAQSLSELSKKEKERRDGLKGRRPVPITNADLGKTKKKAGLETPPAPPQTETAGQPAPEGEPPADYRQGEGEQALNGPPLDSEPGAIPGMADGYRSNLEARYAQAKEYADLLELKIAALWQQFYSLDDMTPRDTIQQEIALTFDKMEKARGEENAVKKELDDYIARVGKENAPPL